MKKKFLEDLELKLNILEDDERKDIINEYKDIIEEKVKHGQTEEEAIKDFGNFDSLVKEILSAYKVKYKESNNSDDFFSKVNDVIKDGADIVVKFFKGLSDDLNSKDFKTEEIVELIIKSIIVMLILMIPFNILKWILHNVTNMILFYPVSRILIFVFDIAIGALYFIAIILVISRFFKDVYDKPTKVKPKTKKVVKKETKDSKKEDEVIVEKSSKAADVIMLIVKIIVIIWIFPLIVLNIVSYMALSMLVYLLIKGVYIVGIVVLVAGASFLLSHLLSIVYNILNNRRVYFYPFIIYLMMIGLGMIMTFDYIINVKKTDQIPGNYTMTTDRVAKVIDSDIRVYDISSDDVIVDDLLLDNVVIFEIVYSKDFATYNIYEHTDNDVYNVDYSIYRSREHNNYSLIRTFIEDLKDNEISNYEALFNVQVKVYANSNTISKIKV